MRLGKFLLLISIVFLWIPFIHNAQTIPVRGTPSVENFIQNPVVNSGKIWQIRQAPNGIMYMAGDIGLIEFDGLNWKNFKGSQGFTRSLFILNDSVIYTGSDLDFGVWKKNSDLEFTFTSLYPFKENSGGIIEEFWHTSKLGEKIIFQSHENLYLYDNEQLVKIPAPTEFTGAFNVQNRYFAADKELGLYEFNGIELIPLAKYPDGVRPEIKGISVQNNSPLLFTHNNGVLKIENGQTVPHEWSSNLVFTREKIFSYTRLNEGNHVVGSILNGLFITDEKGNLIQHINRKKGLTHNTVLSVYEDRLHNLWLSLDYGLARIKINSDFTYFIDYSGKSGTTETAVLWNGRLYVATNQGLYSTPRENLLGSEEEYTFELTPGTEGQIWSLKIMESELLIGHDKGLYSFKDNNLTLIHDDPGILNIHPLNPNQLIAGTYNGIDLFIKTEGKWQFVKKLEGIAGACTQITEFKNEYWVNIPNYGIVRFRLNNSMETENIENFLLQDFNLNAMDLQVKNDTLFLKSFVQNFYYDRGKSSFLPHESRTEMPDNAILTKPHSTRIDSLYRLISVQNGFALHRLQKRNYITGFRPMIRNAVYYNNHDVITFNSGEKIPYIFNNLKFNVISPGDIFVDIEYFLIEGNDTVKGTAQNNTIELIDLPSGNYRLLLQNKSIKNLWSQPFTFKISKPWYFSWWALLAYATILAGLIMLLRYYQHISLKKQKLAMLKKTQISLRQQAEKHQQTLLEKEQLQLQNERKDLLQQLKEKTMELTTLSKQNRDKNRTLELVRQKFKDLDTGSSSTSHRIRMSEIRRILDESFKHDEDHIFEIQIDELHQEFYKKLKKKFSDLTTYDLRLAVYLKLGMNTKEIADIVEVLPSSINVSRSRLRKKLNLDSDDNLFEFLNQF